jgi:hypothetical protein
MRLLINRRCCRKSERDVFNMGHLWRGPSLGSCDPRTSPSSTSEPHFPAFTPRSSPTPRPSDANATRAAAVSSLSAQLFPPLSMAIAACALMAMLLAGYIGLRIRDVASAPKATAGTLVYRAIVIATEALYGLVCVRFPFLALAAPSPATREVGSAHVEEHPLPAMTAILCMAEGTDPVEVLEAARSHLLAAESALVPLKLCVLPSSSTSPDTLVATQELLATHFTNTTTFATQQIACQGEAAAAAALVATSEDEEHGETLDRAGNTVPLSFDTAAVDARALQACLQALTRGPSLNALICVASVGEMPRTGDYVNALAKGCNYNVACSDSVPSIFPVGDAADVCRLQHLLVRCYAGCECCVMLGLPIRFL